MPAKTSIDAEAVQTLATLLEATGLSEIEYETGDLRIRIARSTQVVQATLPAMPAPAAPAVAHAPAAPAANDFATHPGVVPSPMVGIVYLLPEPGAAPLIVEGASITEGQTLLLIEAMKTFNPIRAPRSGKITKILISNGAPVEFGEPLVIIE